ncbi:MAG: GGDEF domain-containing protein, partial [Desulfobacterales bacterium]|nr:GGDEF domain-containing protein [Desulfobacterales bacterium]
MKTLTNKFLKPLSAMLTLGIEMIRNTDYKILTHYMLLINQVSSIQDILNYVGICLHEIFNYRMVGYVIKDSQQVNIWIDPMTSKDAFEQYLINDGFIDNTKKEYIQYIEHEAIVEEDDIRIQYSNILFYEMEHEGTITRLYLLPLKGLMNYHKDIIQTIMKTVAIRLSVMQRMLRLNMIAAIDPLTGCYNRREMDRKMEQSFANAKRHEHELSVIMFDIDHFKKINDTYGHQSGDEVLKSVSKTVLKEIRKGDILARYGGEEFLLLLPETNKRMAIMIAERLRQQIHQMNVNVNGIDINVTASFGVASLTVDMNGQEELIKEADLKLYEAKTNGRNQVMPHVDIDKIFLNVHSEIQSNLNLLNTQFASTVSLALGTG